MKKWKFRAPIDEMVEITNFIFKNCFNYLWKGHTEMPEKSAKENSVNFRADYLTRYDEGLMKYFLK